MNNKTTQDPIYDLKSVKLPYLSGATLRLFATLLEGPLGSLLIPNLFRSSGVSWLREQQFDDPPTLQPIHFTGTLASKSLSVPEKEWRHQFTLPGLGFRFATVQDYAKTYRDGEITPEDVAHRVLEAIEAGNAAEPPCGPSSLWIATMYSGRPGRLQGASGRTGLSVFDGVPVAVKDEVDMVPYPTTVGTAF